MLALAAGGNPSAVTTALIALGGALFGAVAASVTQVLIHWLQGRRDTAAREREVKIAARMMQVDLARAWSNMEFSRRTGKWWATPGLRPQMTDADRRLVIGALTAEGFYTVDLALTDIDHWYSIREGVQSGALLRPVYDPDDLQRGLDWITDAGDVLREITGDPDSIEPEPIEPPPAKPAATGLDTG